MSAGIRESRIQNIKEEMGDNNTQIAFKEKRITAAANMKNVLDCDEIHGEIFKSKTRLRELEPELKELEKKEKQPKRYRRGNSNSSSLIVF